MKMETKKQQQPLFFCFFSFPNAHRSPTKTSSEEEEKKNHHNNNNNDYHYD